MTELPPPLPTEVVSVKFDNDNSIPGYFTILTALVTVAWAVTGILGFITPGMAVIGILINTALCLVVAAIATRL